ncbi:nuclear transport factor 2 family protein [Pendulispora rubella]|uniref:Nuclear transport factor 2 family protein n=1 Tax=Pendulispora rubella TaxID=2741070 RepID=A0ABZ2L6G7_9BACT
MQWRVVAIVPADGEALAHRRCAEQFDAAQRQDMESFRDRDREGFRAVHHPDAIAVYAGGTVHQGIDQIMADAEATFAIPDYTWEWTEMAREVAGCSTGSIVYDTYFKAPSIGANSHLRISVTYTREHGKWLGLIDQTTRLAK